MTDVVRRAWTRGERVRLTAEGRRHFLRPPGPARVVGVGRDGLTVRVRHDGARSVVSYFRHLIEREEESHHG